MKTTLVALMLVWMEMAVGCVLFVPRESLYLNSAQDRATQNEVSQNLGRPHRTSSMPTGGTVWEYEFRQEDPGSRWTSVGMRCDEYVLTFDSQGILRRWTHASELHGGELMPTSCITGDVRSKS